MQIPKLRVFGIRVFDPIVAILALWLLFWFLKIQCAFLWSLVLVFPIGILAHWIFNVPTFLNCKLGLVRDPTICTKL